MHDIVKIIQGLLSYRCISEPQRKKTLFMCMISQVLSETKHSDQKKTTTLFSSMFMLERTRQTLIESMYNISRIGAVVEGM